MKVRASWGRVRGEPGKEAKGWMGTAFLLSFPDCSVSRGRARLCLLARQPRRQRCPRRTLAGAPRAGTSGRLRGQRCAGRTLPHLLPAAPAPCRLSRVAPGRGSLWDAALHLISSRPCGQTANSASFLYTKHGLDSAAPRAPAHSATGLPWAQAGHVGGASSRTFPGPPTATFPEAASEKPTGQPPKEKCFSPQTQQL